MPFVVSKEADSATWLDIEVVEGDSPATCCRPQVHANGDGAHSFDTEQLLSAGYRSKGFSKTELRSDSPENWEACNSIESNSQFDQSLNSVIRS
ncbi:hypothetical protein [Bythopirellula polymerisocia]|uniref:hypothetical protein n=1 Tax=Bythopirellula polymerisocia TaxID=2528003 RepID=UPI0011B83472|nr:hypothetical protein [Bythopirellula polymerisocia]